MRRLVVREDSRRPLSVVKRRTLRESIKISRLRKKARDKKARDKKKEEEEKAPSV